MLRPRWHKVLADLWSNKVRTFLVVASIFIGVFNVGVVIALASLAGEDLSYSHDRALMPDAIIRAQPFDPDLVESVRRLPGVAAAAGLRDAYVRVQTGPDKWLPLQLRATPNLETLDVGIIRPIAGQWPPQKRDLIIDRGSLQLLNAQVGDEVQIKLADNTLRTMRVVGAAFDDLAGPATELGLSGYVSYDTLEWLHVSRELDRLQLRVDPALRTPEQIKQVADTAAEQIRRSGREIGLIYVYDPNARPGDSQILGVIQITVILGFLSFFLSGFLIFNTLSGLLAQQIGQIGIMKAVGARTRQVVGMYLALILVFCTLALLPAIPLAAYCSYGIASMLGLQFNYDTLGFRLVPMAILLQVISGIAVPILAGLLPVLTGTRITIREALGGYGLGAGQFGKGMLDRLVERVRGLSRPLLISLRNTFRRKGRLALTLVTLTLGGAIFISVFNLQSSLVLFMDEISNYFLSDVNLEFDRYYPIQEIEESAMRVPGVQRVEAWTATNGDLLREDRTAQETVQILAPPAESTLVKPIMLAGRWVTPTDGNAIVVSNAFYRAVPGIEPGDTIRLKINDREADWTVVGVFQFPGDADLLAYSSFEHMSKLLNAPGRSAIYRIVGEAHSSADQQQLASRVEAALLEDGIRVSYIQTGNSIVDANASAINIIVVFFLVLASLIALVGAVGLMGTMSMNVLERTREIGVMRSIGATNKAILKLVITEGTLVGLISWVIGALLSLPIGRLLFSALSQALFQAEVTFSYTPAGFVIWLVVVLLLAALASALPASNAARLTVRNALAYE